MLKPNIKLLKNHHKTALYHKNNNKILKEIYLNYKKLQLSKNNIKADKNIDQELNNKNKK